MLLTVGGLTFDLSKRTCIMGVLNVTPDSFSDGGQFFDPEKAAGRAMQIADEGADILDIGGESTRPGSEPVSEAEELRRTIPVIKMIREISGIPISIDTRKAKVAELALQAGADMINDISGLRFDPRMRFVAAESRCPVVVMHMKGTPVDMQKNPVYEALIPEILDCLRESIGIAIEAGVGEDRVVIDPGIGFGKTFDHNLEILKNLSAFAALEKPLLVGVSRKAFIGHVLGGLPPAERLEGTLAAITAAIMNGANIIRVHDVKAAIRAARVADAIKRAAGA